MAAAEAADTKEGLSGRAGEVPSAVRSVVKSPRLQAQPHGRLSHIGGAAHRKLVLRGVAKLSRCGRGCSRGLGREDFADGVAAAVAAEKVGRNFGWAGGGPSAGKVGRELSAPAGAATWDAQHTGSSCGETFEIAAGVAAAAAADTKEGLSVTTGE